MTTMEGRISLGLWSGQRLHQVDEFHDGAWPAMEEKQGNGIIPLGPHMHKVDCCPIDLSGPLGKSIEFILQAPPVERGQFVCPRLRLGQRHALGPAVGPGDLLGPPGLSQSIAHHSDVGIGNVKPEGSHYSS